MIGRNLTTDAYVEAVRGGWLERHCCPDDQTLACGSGFHEACEQVTALGCACMCHPHNGSLDQFQQPDEYINEVP